MPVRRPLILGCLAAALALVACCGPSIAKVVKAAETPLTKQLEVPAPTGGKAIRDELDQTRREKAKILAREDYLEEALAESDRAAIARDLVWIAIMCLAGFGVCVAGFLWAPVPVLKRIAFYGGASFVAVALLALGVREALPWLRWALLAIFGLGGIAAVIFGLPYLRHLVELAHDHADLIPAGKLRDALDRLRAKTRYPKKSA